MTQPDFQTADEFICDYCKRTIWSVPAMDPPPIRCAMCHWINERITDPIERAVILAKLQRDQP